MGKSADIPNNLGFYLFGLSVGIESAMKTYCLNLGEALGDERMEELHAIAAKNFNRTVQEMRESGDSMGSDLAVVFSMMWLMNAEFIAKLTEKAIKSHIENIEAARKAAGPVGG